MTTIAKMMSEGTQLTGVAATYYTCPVGTKAIIKALTLTNTTALPIACTVYIVASAGTASAANTIISAVNIAVGTTYNCPEAVNHVLAAGDFIQAFGLNVSIRISGIETTS